MPSGQEEAVKEKPPSQELTSQVTEVLVRQRYTQALLQKSAPCPQCGGLVQARGLVSRTVPWWGRCPWSGPICLVWSVS
jgi:hypothetical protein